jgi:hypothetical protein
VVAIKGDDRDDCGRVAIVRRHVGSQMEMEFRGHTGAWRKKRKAPASLIRVEEGLELITDEDLCPVIRRVPKEQINDGGGGVMSADEGDSLAQWARQRTREKPSKQGMQNNERMTLKKRQGMSSASRVGKWDKVEVWRSIGSCLGLESAANGCAHNGVDAIETFLETRRDTGDMPAKAESNLLIRGAAKMKAEGSIHSVGVGDDTVDVDPATVLRIRTGEPTGLAHDIANIAVEKHRVGGTRRVAKLAKRFDGWDLEKECSAKNVDSGDHWIERCIRQSGAFACGEVVPTFVETKTEMQRPNVVQG